MILGTMSPARIPRITITTISSIKVNPCAQVSAGAFFCLNPIIVLCNLKKIHASYQAWRVRYSPKLSD